MVRRDDTPGSRFYSTFSFRVSIAGGGSGIDTAFQEVSGLTQKLGVEEVAGGGENRFKYRLPAAPSCNNLVLKRGVTAAKSPLAKWCGETLTDGMAAPIATKDVIVVLLEDQGMCTLGWTFHKAYPVQWEASKFNSQEGAILIETIELAYQYFKKN